MSHEAESATALTYETTRVETLLRDVMHLAEYALEKGKLPKSVNISTLLSLQRYKEKVDEIPEGAIPELAQYYTALSVELAPVTADTLQATGSIKEKDSIVGKHLRSLWKLTGILILTIFAINLPEYVGVSSPEPGDPLGFGTFLCQLQDSIIPFAYGALGSCAYLLRITEQRLRSRQFSPIRIPEHWNRLVLGTLSGGVIVLFFRSDMQPAGVELAQAALGFLAGYSIDFLFDTLDRIITAFLPKTRVIKTTTQQHKETPTASVDKKRARRVNGKKA